MEAFHNFPMFKKSGGASDTQNDDLTTTFSTALETQKTDELALNNYQRVANQLTFDLRRQLCDQNLFVFHLPSEWSEVDLRNEFMQFGTILTAKVAKRLDGTSKGYGFVCFTEPSAACAAVENMNGRSFFGKRLKVSLKKTPEECLHLQVQKLMEISNTKQPYDRDRDCTLFVFHIPSTWEDKDIYYHFHTFGTLLSAKVVKKEDNISRGYGFVSYDIPRSAALAIANMNGVDVGNNKRLKKAPGHFFVQVQLKQQANPPLPAPGCTIFIFHLPNDWTDNHLRQHFNHYGKMVGATVQRDNQGNAKGYGFIRFDTAQSALNAVFGMDGFTVGHKRLKVSLKKGDYSRDYMGNCHSIFLPSDAMNDWSSPIRLESPSYPSMPHTSFLSNNCRAAAAAVQQAGGVGRATIYQSALEKYQSPYAISPALPAQLCNCLESVHGAGSGFDYLSYAGCSSVQTAAAWSPTFGGKDRSYR